MNIGGISRLKWIARRVTNAFAPRVVILLYHRVAELPLDPQLLCVSPRNFAEHLEILRTCDGTAQVRALGEVLAPGHRGERAVIVTFDDGYADNLYNAKPLLERHDIPATVFVTSGYIGTNREFWYDALERILLHANPLPESLRLKVNRRWYQWDVGSCPDEGTYPIRRQWNISGKDDPTVRHALYRTLVDMLQPLFDAERQKVLESLAGWAGTDISARLTHRTLSSEELVSLADGGLVEVGAHTISHPVLSQIPADVQQKEIYQCKLQLEQILGHSVSSFAYPFGGRSHYTDETVAAVRAAGFNWACSNFGGIVRPGSDRWQLPRFLVRNWDGEEFARKLHNWFCS